MEQGQDNNQEAPIKEPDEEIVKSLQQPEQQNEDNHIQLQEELQKQEQVNEIKTAIEKPQPEPPQAVVYDDDDDDEDDDDEEKETSQKLVIDIPEEEEEEEKEDEEDEDDDVIALDDLPTEVTTKKDNENVPPKPEVIDTITLSDGEEDVALNEAVAKPGKIQKRRSMGSSSANDEEHYRLKRRKINVAGAPKLPLTGYVRYMNDRRESLRKEHPTKTHMEHNKMIAEEWHSLTSDIKSSYLKAADVDKQRYVKELHSFLKSRPDILASELAKNKVRKPAESNCPNPSAATTSTAIKSVLKEKPCANEISKTTKDNTKDKIVKEMLATPSTSQQAAEKSNLERNKRKRTPSPPTSTTYLTNASSSSSATATTNTTVSSLVTPTPGEIPIFTNEFLEHNKIYDMELRSVRKSKTDLEQQNSVLEKHVENMKFGVEKMIAENNELEEKNRLLEIYLDKLKRKLALALSALPLPSAPNGATVDNIDKYMQDLYKMSTSNSTGPATLNKAKDIIRKLDLQIQL